MSRKFITKTLNKFVTKETKEKRKETKNNNNDDNDVIIYIGKEPDSIKEFYSNSKILRNKSSYFKKVLSNKGIEKIDGKYVIKEPNINPQAFDVIIKYLSTGHIDVTNKTGVEILNIIITSNELKLDKLIKLAEDSFINNQELLRKDPVGILQIVYHQNSLNNLQEICLKTICLESKVLFDSDKFVNLPAPILEIIMKRYDLNLTEIEIWDYLIKWGLAQEKTLINKEISEWNQENFNIFERILHNLIPLIRYCDISSEDYFYKVRPYEEILPKEIQGEILKFYMIPGYTPTSKNLLSRKKA